MSTKYHSYLIRLWHEGPSWRLTLTNLGSGRQYGFANLETLVDFVRAQMAETVASEWNKEDIEEGQIE